MAGRFSFTLEEFQQAAIIYRKPLQMLPIIGLKSSLQFMTGRPGIRFKENVGFLDADAQFAPYKASRRANVDLLLEHRTLETHFGNVVLDFEPNTAITTLLGTGATKGDGQMQTPTAMHVLALIAKGLSRHLNDSLFNAEFDANGDTTHELFDGFDTIVSKEIALENISVAKGNYMKLTEEITAANALDVAKEILYSLDPILRAEELNLYCSQDFADKYNEAMLLTHGGINFYNQFGQTTVEGSNGRLHLVPLSNKADSKYFQVTPKSNMLVGYDQMSDMESIMVKEYAPFVLTYIATMFFGVQIESLDKRRFKVIELADAA